MKKIILTLALLMGVFAAQAQSLEQNKFFDNMSVTLKGGAIMPFQGYAFWPSARGIFGMEIKKQLTPVFGMGVEGEATINTTSWEKPDKYWGPKSPNIIDHTLAGLFGTVNLGNLFAGYAGKPRAFELEGVIGAGWLHAFHRAEAANMYGNDYNSWYTKAGANLNFNFGESRAITFSLKPAVVWDMNGDIMIPYRDNTNARARWNGEPHNGKSQMNANHAAVELEAGLTYHFKGSNGERYITFCPYKYSQDDIDALNGQINGLRNQLNGLQGDLDAANARNAQLQRDLDAAKKAANAKSANTTEIIDNSAKYMNVLVHFKVNKTNITADQQPNVERVAQYLKNNPTATVDIKGYASPEGPKDNNIKLANGRAEAVKNMLINKYKIDPARITAKGCGETDMFEELSWNRVSICELIVKK
ncbi:MAG: OmpA family protein [Muribaculaceae bacterium]|nr:OmpA family protein [Muribaculaceae bacterium]